MSKRPVTVDDLFKIDFLGQVEISPDGKKIAYVITVTDLEKDGYRSAIHLMDIESGESYQFTSGSHKDTQPRWSPDGSKIAFISNRSGKNQIWVIEVDGGEARQVTKLAMGAGNHAWSPDGQYLAFTSRVKTGEEPALEGDDKKKDKDKSDVKVITRLKWSSNGVGLLGDERAHVFVVPVDGGAARQVTSGECDDGAPAWSPDGRLIAFGANRTVDADYTNVRDIWVVPAVAGEPRQVTAGIGPAGHPAWSADGETIFYIGHDNSHDRATHEGIWSVPASGGGAARLLTDIDFPVGSGVTGDMTGGPAGLPYQVVGDSIFYRSVTRGQAHIYKVPAVGGKAEQLTKGERAVGSFSLSRCGGKIAFASATDVDPGQVFLLEGGQERQLTKLREAFWAELDVRQPEAFTYQGADGWECQGWVIKPPGFQAGRKYPVILEIHGGPHAMYGHTFFHEFQYLAAQGFVVVYTNPRGSQGYGMKFTDACRGDWGGKDYLDIMAGLDHVIAQGYIDMERMGVTGGSYGGYMTSWVVGHTDRFRAAVAQRSLTNRYSFYGTSDIGPGFGESEFPGNPWDDHDVLYDRSPVHYVKNIKTPLLIIHSEQDLRCPIEQSEQLFTFLKRQRKVVEFVRFPDETHELSRSGKPKHRKERLERIAGWMKRFIPV